MGRELDETTRRCVRRLRAPRGGDRGYVGRTFAISCLPHRPVAQRTMIRRSGGFEIKMVGEEPDAAMGDDLTKPVVLPYGIYPRLILAWIVTQAMKQKTAKVKLPGSLRAWMLDLGLEYRQAVAKDFMAQLRALFRFRLFVRRLPPSGRDLFVVGEGPSHPDMDDEGNVEIDLKAIGIDAMIYKRDRKSGRWGGTIQINDVFYQDIIKSPVPISVAGLRWLCPSPLGMDIYVWLTYRMAVMGIQGKKTLGLSWRAIFSQFGVSYPDTAQGLRDFRKKFRKQLARVLVVYPAADVQIMKNGVLLTCSPPHICSRKQLMSGMEAAG